MTFDQGSDGYRYLFAVAYRMLGSVHDAEDAVQDTLVRWHRLSEEERRAVREPMAWLTRVTSRICLDHLDSARVRREAYRGVWLPEPVLGAWSSPNPERVGPIDPADAVTLGESVSLALLAAMEHLTPAERVSLILHDVFAMPYAEIGEIVDRSADACRQLASTARRHLRDRPRYAVAGPERDEVVLAFAQACADGDVERLAQVLDPAVAARADGGGYVHTARALVLGPARVGHYLTTVLRQERSRVGVVDVELGSVNGRTGLLVRESDTLVGVLDLEVVEGRVREITIIVNPDKLHERRG